MPSDLELELAAMVGRIWNGRSCWCVVAINPGIAVHTPTCQDAQALFAKVEKEKRHAAGI